MIVSSRDAGFQQRFMGRGPGGRAGEPMRTAAIALFLLASTTLAFAPPGLGTQGILDLTADVPPGEFRAYRVSLAAPAAIEFGGTYSGVATAQPVLPILAAIQGADGCGQGCAAAIFSYDFSQYGDAIAVNVDLDHSGITQRYGGYDIAGGGWFTTFDMPAGEYILLAASAPAESGMATLRLKVLGEATLLASQAGDSFWARGYDLSADKYDVHVLGRTGVYARAWGYTGAEAGLDVGGRMWGYLGYHQQGGAAWEGPSPSQFGFITDGEPGAYTANFPAEEWTGPLCAPVYGCDPSYGDTREDPPFAIAVDVTV